MLDVKKTLSKILNWSGLKFTWDISTNNTSDTWVPVMAGNTVQHRVLPSNANSSATKYGSVWTDGSISLYRRGNTVHAIGDPNLAKTTARTRFGTIPEGFRPVANAYAPINGTSDYLMFYTDGQILCNARAAGQIWFSCTWAID